MLQAHIAMLVVALIYGGNFTVAKIAMGSGHLPPMAFIWFRALTGYVLFTLLHQLFVREKVARKDLFWLLLCAIFGVAINQSFFFIGLNWTTPVNASLIMTTSPLFVLLAANVLLKENISRQKILGIIFGATGAGMLILLGQKLVYHPRQITGDLMVLVNAGSYGLYLVLVKRLMSTYRPLTVIKWVFGFGLLLVTPFAWTDLGEVRWEAFQTETWFSLLYVLIGTTFLAYLLNTWAMTRVSPTLVGTYMYLQPLFATIIALLAGKDTLPWIKVLSGILILTGVYFSSREGGINFSKKMQKKFGKIEQK